MLSRQFVFSSFREVKRHTRTETLALNFASNSDNLEASLNGMMRGAAESSKQQTPRGHARHAKAF
jgi:hypothetical protein